MEALTQQTTIPLPFLPLILIGVLIISIGVPFVKWVTKKDEYIVYYIAVAIIIVGMGVLPALHHSITLPVEVSVKQNTLVMGDNLSAKVELVSEDSFFPEVELNSILKDGQTTADLIERSDNQIYKTKDGWDVTDVIEKTKEGKLPEKTIILPVKSVSNEIKTIKSRSNKFGTFLVNMGDLKVITTTIELDLTEQELHGILEGKPIVFDKLYE